MFMRRFVLPIAIVVLAAACSTNETTTTTSPPSTERPTTIQSPQTTIPPVATTQPMRSNTALILSRLGGVDLVASENALSFEGDADYPVLAAFDDFAGGLVYQYSTTPEQYPPHSVLHIRAGESAPEVVLFADPGRMIGLLDVEEVDGRLTVLYLEGAEGSDFDSLFIADLAGGAPTLITAVDAAAAPGSAGVNPTAIVNGSLSERSVAVVWWYGDIEADCSYIEVVDFAGTKVLGPIPEMCGESDLTEAVLSADGARLAYAGGGAVEIVDVSSEEMLGSWQIEEVAGLDFDGTTALVTGPDNYSLLSLSGRPVITDQLPPGSTLVAHARSPIDIAAGTFLGGVRVLSSNCSAAGMPTTPDQQGGLPEAVAKTRDGIVAAAASCDIDALKALAGDTVAFSFGADPDAGRFWRWSEQEGYGTLGRIVDVLGLSFVIDDSLGERIYTWPSAFQADPTDEDWQALAALFNEEDIDLFKEYGAYIGMRVGITEDGTWIFAVEGD